MTTFRPLTRKAKQISHAECLELLDKERRGILSVNGDNGFPYSMPMNHYYNPEDGCIYFHCGKGGHRADALLRSDKVCFCVCEAGEKDANDWALHVRSVVVFGTMESIEDEGQIVRITTALSHKFTEDEAYIQNEIAHFASKTRLLKLTPLHVCGKRVKES
ncbi:MAG: pyridoxamine 5'-phosphate oxidase family protein [Clostridia bacterium]|nr:pyridoxamine 5'-phosphate oxidase family protein [Clostridia bacterium]